MSNSPYERPNSDYIRDLDMMKNYVNDLAKYLSLNTGRSVEQEREWVVKQLKEKKIHYKDPSVKLLTRENSDSDRKKNMGKMSSYIRGVVEKKQVMAATLTVYENPEVEESDLAGYTKIELSNRASNKKQKFAYESKGDWALANIYDNRQQRNKIKVNSLSGAQGTPSSVLYDQTAHSGLTTTCRVTTTTSNATTERLLTSNRHYWHVDVAINNIIHIVNNTDYDQLSQAMTYYDIAIPEVEFVIAKVKASCDYYFRGKVFSKVEALIRKLSPMERAAFIYTGDLASLADINPQVVEDMIMGYATLATDPIDDPYLYISQLDEDEEALTSLICAKLLNYKKLNSAEAKENPNIGIVGATAKKILETGSKYKLFFKTFLLTMQLPASMAKFPESIRRSVIASDTDSSIFTTQDWVVRYKGKWEYDDLATGIAAAVTFIAVKVTAHVLVAMSRNFGVAERDLRTFVMKNEYAFGIFSLTTMAKHYYAIQNACEGLVYNPPKYEIKGAQMRNTKAPIDVMEGANQLIEDIIKQVLDKGTISLKDTLDRVCDIEMRVYEGIVKGKPENFQRQQIKPVETYKSPTNSMTLSQKLWNEVFKPKYGTDAVAPYGAIKVNINRKSKAKLTDWLESIEDRQMRGRLANWLVQNNRSSLNTIYLPMEYVNSNGLPDEVVKSVDARTMIMTTMRTYYLILETLGLYLLNKKNSRLLIEEYRDVVL